MEKPHRLHLVVFLLLLCFPAARAAAVLPGPAAQEDATAANLPLEPESEAQPYKPEGQIHLDLVVTTQAGTPVVGLRAQDFTLFDNGQPAKILSFSGYAGAARPDPPASVTLVLDALRVPGSMGYFRILRSALLFRCLLSRAAQSDCCGIGAGAGRVAR